ncbi:MULTISPECIES: PQQ-dependent sugar dehydrogenase [unclassified Microbulbifer]|uniref:PQQ-dependent sugar dehydrogenase n=1 Tax=unclassified Microbulbifer TaxID=2619833 RepID=UPI0027E3BE41|nr:MULTISPECIES: PQQ-dependent sugar dehydrogenase [unclassified Microbulbifer]
MKYPTLAISLALATLPLQVTAAGAAENLYRDNCAGCHGGKPPAVPAGQAARTIREGLADRGMPAFGAQLSDSDIRALAELLDARSRAQTSSGTSPLTGTAIPAQNLNPEQSSGYQLVNSEADPDLRYVGYFNTGSSLCYDDIDLSGVRSVELEYANGNLDPGRFALIAHTGNGEPVHLGEGSTAVTGGWENFRSLRVGLSQQLEGPHQLCFGGVAGSGIFNLHSFTPSDQPGRNEGITQQFDLTPRGLSLRVASDALSAGGHRFRLEPVASATGELWDMDFLPDGTAIATQKEGRLWLFKNGERRGPVSGIPAVKYEGQGGLLGVTVHPDYAENGWIYLTYAGVGDGGAMTTVVRGKLKGLRWVDQEKIYSAPDRFYTGTSHHFGSRLVVRDGYIYFSVGDRGHKDGAQDTGDPRGKIHRLHDDGRIPEDNPFAAAGGAAASVWSYGHRNPQGVALQPGTDAVWAVEHGPRGGDEVNLIQRGRNYGWPLVTFGINYDGTTISEHSQREGMESPKHHWTPSIAVSGIDFYTGDQFPAWRNHLLAASLAAQQLHLLRIDGDKVTDDQVLLDGTGRIRGVRGGPDGYPYLLIGSDIFRLEPVEG